MPQILHIGALTDNLTTIANVAEFASQFFRRIAVEPITQLPRHRELQQSVRRYVGNACGLIVVEIDHAEHLYENLEPVSKTDLLGAIGVHISNQMPDDAHLGLFNAACFVGWLSTAHRRSPATGRPASAGSLQGKHHYAWWRTTFHYQLWLCRLAGVNCSGTVMAGCLVGQRNKQTELGDHNTGLFAIEKLS